MSVKRLTNMGLPVSSGLFTAPPPLGRVGTHAVAPQEEPQSAGQPPAPPSTSAGVTSAAGAPITTPNGAARSQKLAPGVEPFGDGIRTLGAPPWATVPGSPVLAAALRFGDDNPNNSGSGVHIGNGYVLTALHVLEGEGWAERTKDRAWQHGPWVGDAAVQGSGGWVIKAVYGKNELGGTVDLALVFHPDLVGQPAVLGLRSGKSIGGDEPIYVLGDETNGSKRLSAGTIPKAAYALSSPLLAAAVEGGFSGSPALDTDGYLVGVVYAQANKSALMVQAQYVHSLLQLAAEHHADLPQLTTIGFSERLLNAKQQQQLTSSVQKLQLGGVRPELHEIAQTGLDMTRFHLGLVHWLTDAGPRRINAYVDMERRYFFLEIEPGKVGGPFHFPLSHLPALRA